MNVDNLLKIMIEKRASDLHLRVGTCPVFRIDGKLVPFFDWPELTIENTFEIFDRIATPDQREIFDREHDLDFAYSLPGVARFRVSTLRQRGTLAFAIRLVPFVMPTIDQLGLPQICKDIIHRPRGLVLVTGPAGSGKSTTITAMIDYLNETARRNIITIEEPIEYLHHNKQSIIAQRDMGDDTKTFDIAVVHALRQDPDVIFVGEMRDLNTISTGLRAAETGHLVLSTLHTTDAPQTVDRIIDIFPASQQEQVRTQLSQVLEAVLTQCLLPRLNGKGRIAAFEILLGTPAVRNLIRSGKSHEISNVMQLSAKDGMITLDQSLAELVKNREITRENALMKSSNPKYLTKLLQYPTDV